MNISAPASEIIRKAEEQLVEAHGKRLAAFDLLREANAIEEQAKENTIAAMGPENGLIAYELAKWSVPSSGAAASAPESVVVTPAVPSEDKAEVGVNVTTKPAAASAPRKESRTKEAAKKASQKSENYFGENVPPSRTAEADEIVAQASAYVSQGRKGNPFANDRGKNAWRKALFNAAFTHLAKASAASIPVDEDLEVSETTRSPSESKTSLPDETEPPAKDFARAEMEELSEEERQSDGDEGQEFSPPAELDVIDDYDGYISPVEDPLDDDSSDEEPAFMASDPEVERDLDLDQESNTDSVSFDEMIDDFLAPDESERIVPDAEQERKTVEEIDPFDDIGDLPPANTAPPPRGYSSIAPAPADDQHQEDSVPVPKPTFPRTSFGRPAMSGTPVRRAEKNTSNDDGEVSEAPTTPQAHVPRPIPPHRRPGNGQALQQPLTLPSAISGMKQPSEVKKPKPFNPPPFLTRKV